MFFFIREDGKSENRNKITIYNKKNITVDIDQDPINQLVLMLQTSYSFKSSVSVQQSSSLLRLTYLITTKALRAREHYLQVEVSSSSIFQSSATNLFSSSRKVFIEGMRRWDLIKDLQSSINTNFKTSWPLRGSMEKFTDVCLYYFLYI